MLKNRRFQLSVTIVSTFLILYMVEYLFKVHAIDTPFIVFDFIAITVFIFYLIPTLDEENKLDVFSPYVLYPLYFYAFYVLGSLGLYFIEKKLNIALFLKIQNIYLCFIFFYYIALISFDKIGLDRTVKINKNKEIVDKLFFASVVFLLIAHFVSIVIFLIRVGEFPLLAEDSENFRITSMRLSSGYVTSLINLVTPAVIMLFAYGIYYNRKKIIYISIGLIAYSIPILVLMGSKRAGISLLLGIVVVFNYLKKRISAIKTCIIGAALLISAVILGAFRFYKVVTPYTCLRILLGLIDADAFNISTIVNCVPKQINFQYGKTYLNAIMAILPGPNPNFGTIIKDTLGMTFKGGGITIGIIGESYINWGYIGIPLAAILFAALCYISYRILKNRRDFYEVFLYSYFVINLLYIFRNGFLETIVVPFFTVLALVFWKFSYK